MAEPLWTIEALVAATGGRADGDTAAAGAVTGISIDTRTLAKGELFVALKDQRDGHDFVPAAFAKGAAAALVSEGYQRQEGDRLLIRVDDPLRALERMAIAARARLGPSARVIAVTGSAGKTTSKEMLRLALGAAARGRVHASDKSFNNHWGVPLTLARMPTDTAFAVLEIGMNHSGEITPLTGMARPHVAIVTTVEAAHLEAFASVEDIAHAKAEIFSGLEPGGVAVINRDNPHYGLLRRAALARAGVNVVSFGKAPVPQGDGAGSVRLVRHEAQGDGTGIEAEVGAGTGADPRRFTFTIGASGEHMVLNALGVLAALLAADVDATHAAAALGAFSPPQGRGTRHQVTVGDGAVLLIDESYNANPASMRAALLAMADLPRQSYPRRIAVLGDMLELGTESRRLHEELTEALALAGIDQVFAAGPNMEHLYERLPASRRGAWVKTSAELEAVLRKALRAGDAVMIKGSNGSRMGPLVDVVRGLGRTAA